MTDLSGEDLGALQAEDRPSVPGGDAEMVCPLGHQMSHYSPDVCFSCNCEIDKRTRDILGWFADELSEASRGRVATKRTRAVQAKREAANRIKQLVSDFSGSAVPDPQQQPDTAGES